MSYKPLRPTQHHGWGSLEVFRSVSAQDQPLLQEPRQWVRRSPLFALLQQDQSSENAARLHAENPDANPAVLKIWVELAYETVRYERATDLPSRLDSLYACPDPLEAFCFLDHSDGAYRIWRGTTVEGSPWAIVDMSHFSIGSLKDGSAGDFRCIWSEARDRAVPYWEGGTQNPREADFLSKDGYNSQRSFPYVKCS